MSSLVNELNNLDFSTLIGGPIQAAVQAQNKAAIAQVQFIQEVGLIKNVNGDATLAMVDFSYSEENNNNAGNTAATSSGNGSGSGNNSGSDSEGGSGSDSEGGSGSGSSSSETSNDDSSITRTIRVPLLTMLNVPSLRIEEMTIDFNAKLTSVETASTETNASANASLSIAYGKVASLKASAAYQKKSTSGSQVDKTYSMVIHVRVVSDDIPAGLDRVLSLLEGAAVVS